MSLFKKISLKLAEKNKNRSTWKRKLHEIIYEADTKAGKLFDVVLLIAILASVLLVMLESIKSFDYKYRAFLNICEWIITILFTIEYILRVITIKKPSNYIFSFYGVIDFLSTIPKYLSLILIDSHYLVTFRALRLLRVFRILKLTRYISASQNLKTAIQASKTKITVFIFFIVIICIILGTLLYLIEGAENGFTSIPTSVYWAIVTLTTVGFGDITPQTPLGQLLASAIMILGYGIIAIPTGIISAEMSKTNVAVNTQTCPNCAAERHPDNAKHCYKCGNPLNEK